jgi:AcrR family transcriptional regulator
MTITERSRPKKTPLQARSRATYDAVLMAAAHILEAHGLHGFNTNAVAERAGVSIGSLYQYFPNKDAILAALIERRALVFAEEMEALTDATLGASLADDLRFMLTQAVDWHSQSTQLNRVLEAEEQRLADYLDLTPAYTRYHASLVSLIRRRASPNEDVDRLGRDVGRIIKALMQHEGESETPEWPVAIERAIGAALGYLEAAQRASFSRLTHATDAA